LDDTKFSWLRTPVLNEDTVLVFVANPREGKMTVCGIKRGTRATQTLMIDA
jgi:hypothetical protein